MEKFTFRHRVTGEILHEVSTETLCDAVKNGVDLGDIQRHKGFDFFIVRLKEGSAKILINGKYSLIEKDGTIFKDKEGRTEFDYLYRFQDGSTMIKIDGKRSLIEKDGTLFKDKKGRAEFYFVWRHFDGSTEIILNRKQFLFG